ncbi:KPN_02809 family neutral zinc metallopeptidase [Fundicoccus sp. Sow4_D5]|uniref:KPN_02809 family neutral zinc metallopeptidase n=1 Tax=Fundicoccus sp. Sow4_D5 TaxID=3438782 RepID=UPI003F90E5A8
MKWEDLRKSRNIKDRRGQRGGRNSMPNFGGGSNRSGGMGSSLLWLLLGSGGKSKWILIAVVAFMLIGGGGSGLFDLGFNTDNNVSQTQRQGDVLQNDSLAADTTDAEYEFLSAVLGSTEDFWAQEFERYGLEYRYPTLVVFSGSVETEGCGFGTTQVGPFYCPADETLYIDLQFYRDLTNQYDAPGDFAMAYVVAHEVGHHVQNLLGTMDEFNSARQRMSESQANALTVRLELQADYFSGVWARYVEGEGILERGDIQEAMQAAHAVGDDTLQEEAYGRVMPDSFTHGTSQQRQEWFMRGFESGTIEGGDTFNTSID